MKKIKRETKTEIMIAVCYIVTSCSLLSTKISQEHAAFTPYIQVVTIYTASLTFTNSTFCPHSVFMCFVWIWEQTAIISLYGINWLVFITETECLYCAVRTVPLYEPECMYTHAHTHIYIFPVNLSFCLYKETIRHWLRTNTTVYPPAIMIIIMQGMCHIQVG